MDLLIVDLLQGFSLPDDLPQWWQEAKQTVRDEVFLWWASVAALTISLLLSGVLAAVLKPQGGALFSGAQLLLSMSLALAVCMTALSPYVCLPVCAALWVVGLARREVAAQEAWEPTHSLESL